MNAFILEKPDSIRTRPLEKRQVEKPVPAANEVLIKVSACGVCRTDLHVCEGDLPQRRRPVIPGHQIVGTICELGQQVKGFQLGERVGLGWLHRTCADCRYCTGGKENLCENAEFTGWTVDGGFSEYTAASTEYLYKLPAGVSDTQAAPLLCAGIIGYRALRLTGIKTTDWNGAKLGIYGFGAAGHVCIQIARARGADVYVATRDRKRHQSLALELGADWVGDTFDLPPDRLDAAIIFAPAGEIVPAALSALAKGGTLVLAGIHMSPIPKLEYGLLYGERILRTVANNCRQDGDQFLREAANLNIETHTEVFQFENTQDALIALKEDAIRGAAVISH